MWKKQLIALNLALLLVVLAATPALAAGPDGDVIPYVPEAAGAEVVLPDPPAPDWAEEGDLNLQDASDTPYLISVDGTSFWSDQDTSGDRWSYEAEDHTLTLNGYYGGTINASGDLTVYTQNTVSITGTSGGNYGGGGILVDGSLMLIVLSGSLHINAGDGRVRGGDAIYAAQFSYGNLVGTDAYFYGGDATSTYASDSPLGGTGINAAFVLLYGSGRVYIYGGDSSTYSYSDSMSGFGIYADTVYIESDCTIHGGYGVYSSPGIYFLSYCEFEVVNASIYCHDYRGSAVYTPNEGTYWYYNKHTTVSGPGTSITITPNRYRLRLYGGSSDAALPGGATWTSLEAYYPTGYDLSDYLFQRPGYAQLAWTGSGYSTSDPLPLNAYFTPATNCSLNAYWTAANPGDIILNALDGQLANGSFYQKTTGASATLPAQVSYGDGESSLLGWCSLPTPEADADYLLSGQWYEGGATISSDPDQATVLYAQENASGTYAIYHPTAGTLKNGGTILVQGSTASDTDLWVHTPDGSQLAAPEGYTFAGWSTQENAAQAQYTPGSEIHLSQNAVLHLYAVWTPTEYSYTPASGLTITSIPASRTIRVTVTGTWAGNSSYTAICALYDGDKMTDCAVTENGSTVMELQYSGDTPPLCKVFAVNQDWQPIRACTAYTPAK